MNQRRVRAQLSILLYPHILNNIMPKILTIEDDKFLRELIKRKLDSVGFEAVVALDGESGLEKIKTEKPDLVLLDLVLPGVDGFEVLRISKLSPETKNIPIIIFSNLGQQEDIEKALALGAVGYLVKAHFTPNEIVEKVKQVLAKAS